MGRNVIKINTLVSVLQTTIPLYCSKSVKQCVVQADSFWSAYSDQQLLITNSGKLIEFIAEGHNMVFINSLEQ